MIATSSGNTRLQGGALSVLLVLLSIGIVGCTVENKAKKSPLPPPSSELKTVDLCADGDTEKHMLALGKQGGGEAVAKWVQEQVSLPCNVKLCGPGGAKLYPRVATFYVQQVFNRGAGKQFLRLGPKDNELPPGARTVTLNAFLTNATSGSEGIGIALYYFPEEVTKANGTE